MNLERENPVLCGGTQKSTPNGLIDSDTAQERLIASFRGLSAEAQLDILELTLQLTEGLQEPASPVAV